MIALLAAAAVAAAGYDFRGARLGMSLDDFKALPPLGSGEMRCGPPITRKPGVVECERPGDSPFSQGATIVTYDFTPPFVPGGSRLYRIVLLSRDFNYSEALSGLRQRWSEPSETPPNKFTTRGGGSFDQDVFIWRIGTESIKAERPCGALDDFCVSYEDKALNDLADDAAAKVDNAGSRF